MAMDSDSSDDELMAALANRVDAQAFYEECAYCATGGAMNPCTVCHSAFYCSETCKRRHFKSHRAFCIRTRQEQQQERETSEEELESESDEFDDEDDDNDDGEYKEGESRGFDAMHRYRSYSSTMSFRGGMGATSNVNNLPRRASDSIKRSYSTRWNGTSKAKSKLKSRAYSAISHKDHEQDFEQEPEPSDPVITELRNTLTPTQLQKLLELSTRADQISDTSKLDKIQQQVTELWTSRDMSSRTARTRSSGGSFHAATTPTCSCGENDDGDLEDTHRSNWPNDNPPGSQHEIKKRAGSDKRQEIQQLKLKLAELEQKTLAISSSSSLGQLRGVGIVGRSPTGGSVSSSHHFAMLQRCQDAGVQVYLPTLVKDDDAFRKYFKLKELHMPIDSIKRRMASDGVDPELLDTPNAKSPNDQGPPEGAYMPLTVGEDPMFQRYFKLKRMHLPEDQIRLKMEVDGIDPDLLDHPERISQNDLGSSQQPDSPDTSSTCSASTISSSSPGSLGPLTRMSLASQESMEAMPMTPIEANPVAAAMARTSTCAAQPVVERKPLLVKDDPTLKKYFKLVQMGMPKEQVRLKMTSEGIDASLLDGPDDISPNDVPSLSPSVSAAAAVAPSGSTGSAVSLEHLYSLIMQHQQIIQQGSFSSSGSTPSASSQNGSVDNTESLDGRMSSVDHMANELAAAESAVEDLFGEDQPPLRASSGMSMIQQLERKARRDTNKKIVQHRVKINQLVAETVSTQFSNDQDAIGFYRRVMPQFEACGLVLGTECSASLWSSRLLIKNKETRDWYFSEPERVQAGCAYERLWALSFLERDTVQLISKRDQLLQAPATLLSNGLNKHDMMTKFTVLLKEAVRLKHKIFKNQFFRQEVARLQVQHIPERLEQHGDDMMQAARVLADACMQLAEEEFKAVERTTRCQRIRAQTALTIGERAVQFVTIVGKLKVPGIDGQRLERIESTMESYRDRFGLDEQHDEEEEDDAI